MKEKLLRWLEFILLFGGIPLWIYLDEDFRYPSVLVLPVLVFIFLLLRRNQEFSWKELWQWDIRRSVLLRHLYIFLGMAVLMLGYVYFCDPDNLFNLPRSNPWIFMAMCFFYPVFSAYGQEIIYRTFLFRRYRSIIPGKTGFILASGMSFSFLHIVYYDPVSMIMTLVGGLYLAKVYLDTRSVLFSAVLHGL